MEGISAMSTAHAPMPALVQSLANAGWGDLAGREFQGVRTVLVALMHSLPYKSAQGTVTEAQVAQRAGLSERWVRRCMHVLEDLGVIEHWTRGGVVAGRPTPSMLRLSKRAVVALIEAARPLREAANAARRRITQARIAGLAYIRRNRRSAHAELNADLPTPTGEYSGTPPRRSVKPPPAECPHGDPRGLMSNGTPFCPFCRKEQAA